MTDCASPTAALATGTLPPLAAFRPVSASVAISAARTAAPRPGRHRGTRPAAGPGGCAPRWPQPSFGRPRPGERRTAGEERPEPVVVHAQRGPDGHVHIQVLVGAQAAAEKDARLAVGHFP